MRLKLFTLTAILFLFGGSILRGQIITTIAGNHVYGFSGAGGPATSAEMTELFGIAVDNAGNVYTSDQDNNVIWKISNAGIISIYAGNGTAGYSGDGGPATGALLHMPTWMGIDPSGNLYFIDQKGIFIRKINAAGIISTIAGNPSAHFSAGDGGLLSSASFYSITGVVPDNAGNIFITDNNTIRKVNSAGIINTIAGTGTSGFSGDGGPATAAQLRQPYGVAVDNAGNIYIPDAFNQRIRKINNAGIISTIAGNGVAGYTGNGGPAVNAEFNFPCAVSVDNSGNVYIVDALNNVIRKIDNTGIISDYAGDHIEGYSGDGGLATAAQISYPFASACDNAGNYYFPDLNNYVVRKVTNCLTAQISLQPADNTICAGGNASFTLTATNLTAYQWQLNNGSGWSDLSDAGVYSGTASNYLRITSAGASMNNYQYRCFVKNPCASITTVPATLTVNSSMAPTITIATSSAGICSGTPVSFTASPTNGGSAPSYYWQLNGSSAGTNSPTYTNNSPVNGDVISCLLTSSVTCVANPTVLSNSLSLTVDPPVTPILSIAASVPAICYGTTAYFTASPTNGGSGPTYQWQLNGNNTGTNSPSFSSNTLVNGDIVNCVVTSNAACATVPTAVSNNVSIIVRPLLTPELTIAASAPAICSGAMVSFTVTPTNGGPAPSYQWQLNGNNTGTNSPSYISNSSANGDVISCILTSDALCLASPTSTATLPPIIVEPLLTPGVSITGSAAAICQGTSVEFTADPVNGGSTPTYQWQLNGIKTGSNSPTYTNSNLANGDIVDCIMTGNMTCAIRASATSNTIVGQVTSVVNASVTIAASTATICTGAEVSFTATPTNGGNIPFYQWLVNGNNSGGNKDVFTTTTLANGDVVSCILTSSLSCTAPVLSDNTILMTVNLVPSLSLMPDTIIGFGTSVQLYAVVSDPIAKYQWTPVSGLSNPIIASPYASPLNTTTYQLTVKSDAGCQTSGKVTIGVFRELKMPNAFTPNDDGNNDVFRIPPSVAVKIKNFSVYNRWGRRVFMINNSGIGWDGTSGGRPQPAGTYVWQIEYEDPLTKKTVSTSGTVLLIR